MTQLDSFVKKVNLESAVRFTKKFLIVKFVLGFADGIPP